MSLSQVLAEHVTQLAGSATPPLCDAATGLTLSQWEADLARFDGVC